MKIYSAIISIVFIAVSLIAAEKKIAIEKALFSGPWNTLLYNGNIHTSDSGLYLEGELTTDTFNLADALDPSNKEKFAGTSKTYIFSASNISSVWSGYKKDKFERKRRIDNL